MAKIQFNLPKLVCIYIYNINLLISISEKEKWNIEKCLFYLNCFILKVFNLYYAGAVYNKFPIIYFHKVPIYYDDAVAII